MSNTPNDNAANAALNQLRALYALSDAERFPAAQLAEGLKRESTIFWADFTVAESCGVTGIAETIRNCHFKTRGYKVVTELAVVLNHKIWEWDEKVSKAEAEQKPYEAQYNKFVLGLYSDFYDKVLAWVNENLKDDEASFFWRVMD